MLDDKVEWDITRGNHVYLEENQLMPKKVVLFLTKKRTCRGHRSFLTEIRELPTAWPPICPEIRRCPRQVPFFGLKMEPCRGHVAFSDPKQDMCPRQPCFFLGKPAHAEIGSPISDENHTLRKIGALFLTKRRPCRGHPSFLK